MKMDYLNLFLRIILFPFTVYYWLFRSILDICHKNGLYLPRIIYWLCFILILPLWLPIKFVCVIYEPIYINVYTKPLIFKEYHDDAEIAENCDLTNDLEESIDAEYTIKVNLIHSDDSTGNYYDSDRYRMHRELSTLREQYDDIFKKHVELEEIIKQAYSVAINYTGLDSKEMLLCVEKCNEDFKLIPDIIEYYRSQNNIYSNYGIVHSDYKSCPYSIKRMLIIMEKMGKYDEALGLCQWALDNGLTIDGTDGGIVGRMARIARKSEEKNH